MRSFPVGALYCALLTTLLSLATPPSSAPAQEPAERRPTLNISGIIFGHYMYRVDDDADGANRFDIERAELTARGSLAQRTRYRFSVDVFQQAATTAGTAAGWGMRARYAYLEHDLVRGGTSGMSLSGRIGMIHTVVISQQELFWPRWIHRTPVDRAGYFSSSDLGAALMVTLPNRLGNAYAVITNGPGIGGPETDRFKDAAARVSLTPWARGSIPFLRSLAVTVWGHDGAVASRFAAGGPEQVGPVDDPMDRNRWGLHMGVREPALTAGISWSERTDETEAGENTPADPRVVDRQTSRLVSVHGTLRPARLADAESAHPLGLVARWDRTVSSGSPVSDFVIAGLIWELAPGAAVAVDFQTHRPRSGASVARTDAWLLQFLIGF